MRDILGVLEASGEDDGRPEELHTTIINNLDYSWGVRATVLSSGGATGWRSSCHRYIAEET